MYSGSPVEMGVYLIANNLVTTIATNSKVSYTVNENTNVVFTSTATCLAYYEMITFPET